jgi:hypothetical protein
VRGKKDMTCTIDRADRSAQGGAMRQAVRYLLLVLGLPIGLGATVPAGAQMQPHRAEYALRLGTAANAPRIGSAVNDLSRDCAGWHLKRDITTDIALTAGWKISLASKLDALETLRGSALRYRTLQIQNGNERETRGRVERTPQETRAEIVTPSGPNQFVLPRSTLMPVAAIDHLIERLRAGAANFPALTFDAEVIGDAFLVDVAESERSVPRFPRTDDNPSAGPSGKSWPVFMTFTRGRLQDQRPLFTVSALLFETGVLDRLSVDTGLVTVIADLKALEMRQSPSCPRS